MWLPYSQSCVASIRRRLKRKILIGAACLLLVGLGAVRTYLAFVPRGVKVPARTRARVDGPELRSPDGRRVVRVYFNDAGALHSGNHWTWVVEDSWSCGRRVVVQGYLGGEVAVRGAPVPLQWARTMRFT
jgi:hypothetical protein